MAASVPALNRGATGAAASHTDHIIIEGIHKSFGSEQVLRGIDLTIAQGQFVALVGKSGCGKSTLLRLIAGLDSPTEGRVLIDGELLKNQNTGARVMFQDARLLPWKRVLDNVGLGRPGNWRQEASKALLDVGLTGRERDWPAVLSGGQRQRVALARALVSRPRLLLLDEPLGALDALTRIEMQRLIERLWRERGFTVLLITHDVEEAVTLADRVILIDQGKISLDEIVNIPRPRQRNSAHFGDLSEKILESVLGKESKPLDD